MLWSMDFVIYSGVVTWLQESTSLKMSSTVGDGNIGISNHQLWLIGPNVILAYKTSHMRIENRDSLLKQDQMEEDLEEDPGLRTRNA